MNRLFTVVFAVAALTLVMVSTGVTSCGDDCDKAYKSDIQNCHLMYGDDPEDGDSLADCIQTARDDYRSCLDDCADQAD